MNKESISVALSVYNGERFLGDLLESILSQTRQPDEIIICDDGSEDNSIAIIEKNLKGVAYKIIQNPANVGIQESYKNSISACKGNIIFLCDQDDVWEPFKIENTLKVFRQDKNVGMVFSDSMLVDENLGDIGKTSWEVVRFTPKEQMMFLQEQSFFILLKRNVVTSSSTLALRARYKDITLPIPPDIYPDYWTALVVSALAPIRPLRELLVKYRIHGSNTSTFNINDMQRIKRAWKLKNVFPNEIQKFNDLKERLTYAREIEYAFPDSVFEELNKKINHLSRRANLPKNRIKRIPSIVKAITNKDYFKYSEGWKSVARDMVV